MGGLRKRMEAKSEKAKLPVTPSEFIKRIPGVGEIWMKATALWSGTSQSVAAVHNGESGTQILRLPTGWLIISFFTHRFLELGILYGPFVFRFDSFETLFFRLNKFDWKFSDEN